MLLAILLGIEDKCLIGCNLAGVFSATDGMTRTPDELETFQPLHNAYDRASCYLALLLSASEQIEGMKINSAASLQKY